MHLYIWSNIMIPNTLSGITSPVICIKTLRSRQGIHFQPFFFLFKCKWRFKEIQGLAKVSQSHVSFWITAVTCYWKEFVTYLICLTSDSFLWNIECVSYFWWLLLQRHPNQFIKGTSDNYCMRDVNLPWSPISKNLQSPQINRCV